MGWPGLDVVVGLAPPSASSQPCHLFPGPLVLGIQGPFPHFLPALPLCQGHQVALGAPGLTSFCLASSEEGGLQEESWRTLWAERMDMGKKEGNEREGKKKSKNPSV